MISVIIPIFKAEHVLTRCIESIISQTHKDWELLLINDGSPDASGLICEQYALKYPNIKVINQSNQGPSAARNTGIERARGEFICFVDADDYVKSDYLSGFQLAEDSDLAIQGFSLSYSNNRENENIIPPAEMDATLFEVLSQSNIPNLLLGPCCKLFKRQIIDTYNIRFPRGLHYSEDAIFVMRYLMYCNRISIRSISNYIYTHENEGSLTSRFHHGDELMEAVTNLYFCFDSLSAKTQIPSSYRYWVRHYLAIDFYQSVYNNIFEFGVFKKNWIRSIQRADENLWRFVKSECSLPITFFLIKILCLIIKL